MFIQIKRNFLTTFVFLLALNSKNSDALDYHQLGGTLAVYGDIVSGDYQKFIESFRSWEVPPTLITIDSKGGNVYEAIAIAKFIRLSRIPVKVPGECYSACAFIYLAATKRSASGEIGLHRTYFEPEYYSNLSSYDAELEFESQKRLTDAFMNDIGIEKDIQQIIRSTPSNQMKKFTGKKQISSRFGEEADFLQEWNIAKCGIVEDNAIVAWCTNSMVEHYQLNSQRVDGWNERFKNDPFGELTNHLPHFCFKTIDSSIKMLKEAAEHEAVSVLLPPASIPVSNHLNCINKAENKEVWRFFKSIKESGDVYALLNIPAREFVERKYGK